MVKLFARVCLSDRISNYRTSTLRIHHRALRQAVTAEWRSPVVSDSFESCGISGGGISDVAAQGSR